MKFNDKIHKHPEDKKKNQSFFNFNIVFIINLIRNYVPSSDWIFLSHSCKFQSYSCYKDFKGKWFMS